MTEIKYTDENGKRQTKIVPTKWEELSLAQLVKVSAISHDNVLELFCIITGIPTSVPENSRDKSLERNIWQVVEFIGNPPNWKELKPLKRLFLNGVYRLVPEKFSNLMIGQKIMIAQCVRKVEDMIEQMPRILAIIFQPVIDNGKFESKRIDKLAGEMLEVNGIEGYAIASSFFLRSKILRSYGISGLKEYQKQLCPMKKPLKNWLISEG